MNDDHQKYRVLIIDDEDGILDLCRRVLGRDGYTVVTANRGEKAIEIIAKESFDLVLSDLKMPGLDGIELLKKVKAISPNTEVIIITGQATIETAIESIKNGAYDYILKPFNISELLTAAEKCIEYGQLRRRESVFRETTYLYQLAQEMTKSKNERDMLGFMLERMAKALSADSGTIFMFISEKESLIPMADYGGLNPSLGTELKLGERIAGWVAEKREPLLIQDGFDNTPQFRGIDPRHEIVSSMVVPLIHQDMLLGVVCLNRFAAYTNYQFTPHDLDSLKIFVLHATMIIAALRHRQALHDLDELKSEFMANVSHELRTPLMAIGGALELLAGYALPLLKDEKAKMFLDLISRNTDRMRFLVNDLLDFSRMETKRIKIFKMAFDLPAVTREAIQDLHLKADEKKITLTLQHGFPQHLSITADRERIKQVMLNLISNAIKFTHEGGWVTIGCSIGSDTGVHITVADSGIGIPQDKLEKIFEKFYQVDGSVSRNQAGFGLGLAIVKSIVDAHDGRIWAESEPEKGTVFHIVLPSCCSVPEQAGLKP